MAKPMQVFLKIEDRDKGMKILRIQIRSLDGLCVKAGVLKSAKQYKTGKQVAEIARHHEFGTSKMPARPFMAPAFDKSIPIYMKKIRTQMRAEKSPYRYRDKMRVKVGESLRTSIRKSLKGPKKKLKDKTLLSKSVKETLRETYRLYRSIQFEQDKK